MTRPSGSHLSADEIEAWIAGAPSSEVQQHLEDCRACLEQVQADREIAEQIRSLPLMSPSEDFADRIMASVIIPDPFAIRSMQATRRRLFATRRSFAAAASLLVVLLGSMAGSIAWSLANQETMAQLGSWLFAQGGQALWLGLQGLASNLIEQPWYNGFRSLTDNPGRLAMISALGSIAYLGGLVALRRLLAVPTQRVAHVGL